MESFNDANSIIQLNDRGEGVTISKGCLSDIAGYLSGMNAYNVSVHPITKVDIKDERIHVTYIVQCFEVEKTVGSGAMSALSNTRSSISTEKWPLEACYLSIEKDEYKAKKTFSKALIITHVYSSVIIDKTKEAVKNSLASNESGNW